MCLFENEWNVYNKYEDNEMIGEFKYTVKK